MNEVSSHKYDIESDE